jgi:hypothetical protein
MLQYEQLQMTKPEQKTALTKCKLNLKACVVKVSGQPYQNSSSPDISIILEIL